MQRMTKKARLLPRLAAITTVATAAALTIAGCTPAGAGSSSGDGETITVWHYYSLENQVAMLDEFKSTFEASHEGVTVENVYVPQDQLNSKLVGAVGTQTGPDIVVFDGYSATTLIGGGALAPITSQWEAFDDASEIAEGAVTSVEGEIYSVQGYVNLLGLIYNKTILDELGLEPPTSIDELETDMAAAKAAGYQGITLAGQPDVQGAFQAYPWLTAAGFSYDDPQTAPLVDAFTRVRGWVEDGWLSPQVATWDQNIPFTEFLGGKTLFAENGNWQLSTLASDASFDYGVVPIPAGPEAKVYLGGEAQAIGAFSKHPDLAWQYLEETFFSKDGQLTALDLVGSIPTRSDAAGDDAISSDPYLSAYSEAIATQGAPFPDTVIPPQNNEATILANGQAWSAALGGQTSPADAAAAFLSELEKLLK
ncbi:MAG TPA: extracellular solute-binding protein [Microbacterium sp.]|uniref:sugar ABC transporter substrate-binding protein n=1 Tax=Microbacterium sp. TaxID=51671 RepID=UPI002B5FC44A|nr:extracellular solute-binding protein [Microbacterium sp.]HWI30063.1 extracellular solute-binding protein [Microbacterium sp.]